MKTSVKILILIGAIIAVIIALFIGSRVWLNYEWFAKLGFLNVFVKTLLTKIWLWFTFFFIFVIFAGANILAGFRKGNIQGMKIQQGGVPVEISKKVGIVISFIVLLILGLIMAGRGSGNWELILKFLNQADFNLIDPVLSRDVSFYTFTLPVYTFLKSWSLGTVLLTIIAVVFLYHLSGNVSMENGKVAISDQAKRHIMFLFMLVAVIIAWNYWLKVYQLLFSKRGIIFGAGFTDIKVSRFTYYIMIAVSLFTAILTYAGIRKNSFKLPLIGYGLLIGGAIVITGIIPGIFQQISVKPNELVRELPYIKNNINFTRKGFNLDIIER